MLFLALPMENSREAGTSNFYMNLSGKNEAVWNPAWYGFDQEIEMGDVGEFWFVEEAGKLHFYRQRYDDKKEIIKKNAKILEIRHPEFGRVKKVNIQQECYGFELYTDQCILVNSSDYPGDIIEGERKAVADFSCTLMLYILP